EGARVDVQRVGEPQAHVVHAGKSLGERRFETPVDLDRVHKPRAAGQPAGEDAQSRPDLEHHVRRLQRQQGADQLEHVVVDQEVLAELPVGRDAELPQPGDGDLGCHTRSIYPRAISATPAATAAAPTARARPTGSWRRTAAMPAANTTLVSRTAATAAAEASRSATSTS